MADSTTTQAQSPKPRRVAQIVYLRPECIDEYRKCHAAVWPAVLEQIRDSNIVDYSINLITKPRLTLYATFKYVGSDWDADMARMAANETVQEWWRMTDKMQESPNEGAKGSLAGNTGDGAGWWAGGEEVFYFEG
ncbi:DUF718 domain protein [Aaosphaeria arxii CBS 175.79]|uniref:DUF718 domain protein n=1 Tax=Aaosphaeria arxii CBS 175.79 TaxID=1450172 RepID=A0A6A5X6E7_9PLEO|nr:DUF718 domain protein [Aaosphaeria arxii CBS 175.79]KAF2008417.1 DUF718 domain protein [Aaosphaeria arxii CBS 175.79]